jgi:hypothetical protein
MCDPAERLAAERAGIPSVTWQDFRLDGPPGRG